MIFFPRYHTHHNVEEVKMNHTQKKVWRKQRRRNGTGRVIAYVRNAITGRSMFQEFPAGRKDVQIVAQPL